MASSSGWDDGYMDRYPKQQYGHGVPNVLPVHGTTNPSLIYPELPSDRAIAKQRAFNDTNSYTPAYGSAPDASLIYQGAIGVSAGGATYAALSKIRPTSSWGVGAIGKLGLAGIVGLSAIGYMRGVDTTGLITSSMGDTLSSMTTRNPYAGLMNQEGLPILPTNLGSNLGGTRLAGGGIRTLDSTGSPTDSNGALSLLGLTVGAGVGVGLSYSLDKFSLSIAKGGVYNVGDSSLLSTQRLLTGSQTPLTLPDGGLAYKSNWRGLYASVVESKMTTGASMGKNFAPLIMGAVAGGLMGGPEGALVGGGLASYLGSYLLSKEELGPQLGKRLGAAVVGATIMSMVARGLNKTPGGDIYNVIDSTSQREGTGNKAPYDVFRHPRGYELAQEGASPTIAFINEGVRLGSEAFRELFTPNRLEGKGGVVGTKYGSVTLSNGISVPSYSGGDGYKEVPVSALPRADLPSPNALTNPLYASAQVGLFYLPMALLTAYGASKVYESGVPGAILKAVGQGTSNYMDKVRYVWPGQTLQKEGAERLVSGLVKGEANALREGTQQLVEGSLMSARGSLSSNIKKLSLYAIPLSMAANYYMEKGVSSDQYLGADYSRRTTSSHWNGVPIVVPNGAPGPKALAYLNAQRYMAEGSITRLPDSIFYDSGMVGKGFRDFIMSAPDGSMKAALYSMGTQPDLLRAMDRALMDKGAIISGGSPIQFSAWESLVGIADSFGYHAETMAWEGVHAGITSITSPLSGIINSTAHLVGVSSPYAEKDALLAQGIDPNSYRNPLGTLINAGIYGGLGAIGGGFLPMSKPMGRAIGALVGVGLSIGAKTYSDDTGWRKTEQEVKNTSKSLMAYSDHVRLTGADPTMDSAYMLAGAATIGGVVGAGVGYQLKGRALQGSVIGAGVGLFGVVANSLLRTGNLLPKLSDLGVGGVQTKGKMVSVLTEEKYEPGKEGLTHLHSKALWTKTEAFITTGNVATLWDNAKGDETQFNVGVRIRGEQGRRISSQLDKLHSFLKKVTPSSDLSALEKETPDLILGGKGSKSKEKILSFLREAKGDVWISAPYVSMGEDSKFIVKALKDLAQGGHKVSMLSQNPDGVMGGGKEELSDKVLSELMAAGVRIYMTPKGSATLEHAKVLVDEDSALITSHNLLSANSINKVIEVGVVLHGKEYGKAMEEAIKRRILKVGAVELSQRPDINQSIHSKAGAIQATEEAGKLFPGFTSLTSTDKGYLMPASMGGSYFYARGQYNALMRQAGLTENIITSDDASIATSMYQVGYLARNGRNADQLPQDVGSAVASGAIVGGLLGGLTGRVGGALLGSVGGALLGLGVGLGTSYVTQYDKELTSGGIGAAINEWGASNDWGRLYKDEVGFLPSIAGLLGRVLDRTYLYASPSGALWADKDDGQVIGKDDMKYPGESKGFFESFLSKGTEIGIGAISSVALYLAIGEPVNILLGEMVKGEVESLINVGASADTFKGNWVQGIFTRQLTTGMGIGAKNVQEYREGLLREVSLGARADYEGLEKARGLVDYLSTTRKSLVGSQVVVKHDPSTPGGKAALEQAIVDLDRLESTHGMKGFFSIDRMGSSIYHIDTLTRERAGTLVEGTLKPFILEHIDPYTEGSKGALDLRKAMTRIINEMRRPAQLDMDVNEGSTRAMSFIREVEERRDAILKLDPNSINARQRAREDIVRGGKYAGIDDDIASVTFRLRNAGKDRASRMASVMQEVLDMIPLPLTQWRFISKEFGGGVDSPKDIKVLGDIFSLEEITNSIGRALQGTGGLSEYIGEYKALAGAQGPDLGVVNALTSGPGRLLKHIRARHEAVQSLKASSVAISKMERSLYATGNIRWGHELSMSMVQKVEDDVLNAMKASNPALDITSPKVQAELYKATQVKLEPLVDPLVREITKIDNALMDVLSMQGVQGTLGARNMAILGETMRVRQHSSYMSGATKKKLDRVRAGWGRDATSGVTKGKLGTAAVTVLALSIFAERLVRTTDGVSIFSQLSTALAMRADGIQVSTEFKGDALLPTVAGVPLDYLVSAGLFVPARIIANSMQGQRVLSYAMRKDTVATSIGISRGELNDVLAGKASHTKVGALAGGMAEVELFPGVRTTLHMAGEADEFMRFSMAALEGNRWRNTAAIWALSMVALTVATKGIASVMNTSRSVTSTGAMDQTILGTIGSVTLGGILGRTMGPKALVAGMVAGAIAGAVIGSVTSHMRDGREGTLDPIALGMVGVGVGRLVGGTGRRGLAGALIGGGLGLVAGLFTSFLKVGRNDWEAVNKKEATILADMTTYIRRVKERAKDGDASRLELMGAYYAMGWSKTLRGTEQAVQGRQTQVVARQAVLPFLQVFMAETIKGTTYNKDGTVRSMGTSYYSVGVQGPIVTGTSVPINLPFKVTRDSRGTIGLAMNEDDNVGTFMGDVSSVRTAILTTLTGLGLITGTANLAQAGIRSLATRTPYMANLLDGSWDKGIRHVVSYLTEGALMVPSTALRITMSMSGVDYMVAGKAFMPKGTSIPTTGTTVSPTAVSTKSPIADPAFYGRHIGKALIWGVLGAAIGSGLGGIMSSNNSDPLAAQAGASTGGLIGASVGTGLYMAAALTKESKLGAGIISRMGRVRVPLPNTLKKVLGRASGVLALMTTLGTLLTSSTFGVAVGMDKPPSWSGYQEKGNDAFNAKSKAALEGAYFPSWVPILGYREPTPTAGGVQNLEPGGWTYQRAMTVGLYATVGTAVMSMYGGMGKSAGDTIDEYMRLVRRKRPSPNDNLVSQAVDRVNTWRASHLEKDIDTILRRGYDIGGDALEGNLVHLHDASKVLYENKIYKAVDIISNQSPAVGQALDKIVEKGRGFGVSVKLLPDLLPRRALRGATFLGALAIGAAIVTTSMGTDTKDRVYDHLDSGNGLMRSIGDTIRLFTGTDRSIEEDSLLAKQYVKDGGFPALLTKRKMLKGSKDLGQSATSLWKQMSELMVFDAPNAFVGVQVLGGVTLRRGEYGDRLTPYLQVQGAGADISTATYSMSASFLFNSIGTSQDLHFNMVNAMRELHTLTSEEVPITQAHLRRASIGILSYTAKMQPLLKPRKYSRPSSETLSAAAKDPLIALSLAHRQAVTRQMAYQPPESLISAMLKENMNPAYRGTDGNLMAAILRGAELTGSTIGNLMNDMRIHGFTAFQVKKGGLVPKEENLSPGEWLEDEPATTTKEPSQSLLGAPVRMLLGILPTPIAYIVGVVTLGAVGMFAAASVGGFFLNREVNAIEEALSKHYSRAWYIADSKGWYPHKVSKVLSPPGTQITPRSLYSIQEGSHGTMFSVNPHLIDEVSGLSPKGVHKLVELAQDAINQSLTNNGVLFGDYMRTSPYLQQVTGVVTGVHGKEARVAKLVDEISSPLMGVVDKYFTAIDETVLDLGNIIGGNGKLGSRKVPFLSLFTGASLDDVIANPQSWGKIYGEGFQSSLSNRFADGMQPYNKMVQVNGMEILDPVGTYKEEIRKVIRDVVEEHMGRGGSLTKLNWGTVKADEDGVLHLVQRALDKLRDKAGPLGRMRHEWAGIGTPIPADVADRFEDLLGASIDMGHAPTATQEAASVGRRVGNGPGSTSRSISSGMSDIEWRARRARPTDWNKVRAGGKVLSETFLSVFQLFEVMDVWGAFGRAAEAYGKNSTYTTGEQKELAQEAGYVGAFSLMGATVLTGMFLGAGKVIGGIGALVGMAGAVVAGTASLSFASGAALLAVGAAALGIVAGLRYGAINMFGTESMKASVNGWVDGVMKVSADVGVSRVLGSISTGVSRAVDAIAKGASRAFDWTVNSIASGVDYLGNKTGSGGVAAVGGLAGGALLGAGVAGLSYVAGSGAVAAAGAGVAGVLGLGATAAGVIGSGLVVGGIAITSALAMGLWGTLDPKGMQKVWSKITGTLSSATKDVPIVGEGFLATKRGTWLQGYTNPLGSDSPFFVGTAQQAIEWEFQKTIELNMDYSGDKVTSSIVDPSIYGYSPNAPTNSSLRPDSVVDNLISSEIKLRGQLHNQTIIGQYIWRSVLSSASNKAVILKEERMHIQASYERVMQVMAPGKVVGTTLSIRDQVDVGVVASLTSGLKKAIKDGTPKGVTLKVSLPTAPPSHMQAPVPAPLKVSKARSTSNNKVVVKQAYSPLNVYFMDVIAQALPYPGHSSIA